MKKSCKGHLSLVIPESVANLLLVQSRMTIPDGAASVWLAEVVALEVALEFCNSCKFCKSSSGSFSDDKILLELQVYVLQDSL